MVDLFVVRIIDLLTDGMVDLFLFVNTDRTLQFKLNAQFLRLFGVHSDVNDAHRAGANRLNKNKTKTIDATSCPSCLEGRALADDTCQSLVRHSWVGSLHIHGSEWKLISTREMVSAVRQDDPLFRMHRQFRG